MYWAGCYCNRKTLFICWWWWNCLVLLLEKFFHFELRILKKFWTVKLRKDLHVKLFMFWWWYTFMVKLFCTTLEDWTCLMIIYMWQYLFIEYILLREKSVVLYNTESVNRPESYLHPSMFTFSKSLHTNDYCQWLPASAGENFPSPLFLRLSLVATSSTVSSLDWITYFHVLKYMRL